MLSTPANVVKSIGKVIRNNIAKKLSLPRWHEAGDRIKNWFFLYFIYSSFLIDIIAALFRNSEKAKRLKIKVSYRNGLSMYFPMLTSTFYSILLNLAAEKYLSDFKRLYLRDMHFQKDDVVIDIGAHVGTFAIPIFIDNPFIRVFAYEPDPGNFNCLKRNLKANRIDQSRFLAQPLAVYKVAGRIPFSVGKISTRSRAADISFSSEAATKTICVKAITLKDIFKQNSIDRCKLLKIDCEGGEFEIFKNIPNEILGKIEHLFVELHPVCEEDRFDMKEYLRDKGFMVKEDVPEKGNQELYCVREDS